jgi:hypothetical protein
MRHPHFALGVAIAAVTVSAPVPAAACGGADLFFSVDNQDTPQRVAQAAAALARGDHHVAYHDASGTFSGLDAFPAEPTFVLPEPPQDMALFMSAQHTMAMAAARSGGAVGPWPVDGASARLRNVSWAAIVTQFHAAVRPDDPLLWANAAEAAAAVPTLEPMAYELLIDLHARDLIPHGGSYVLLARLQRARGDHAGSELSLRSCRHLAADDEACRLPGGPNA